MVIVAIGVLVAIALPSLIRARTKMNILAARDAFASTHALARLVAVQYGHVGRLHIDAVGGKFWVTVDTSSVPGVQVEDTVQPVVYVSDQFGHVRIKSNRKLLCFNPRGLGTAIGVCDLPNATVVFSRGGLADSVTVSRVGRLRKR